MYENISYNDDDDGYDMAQRNARVSLFCVPDVVIACIVILPRILIVLYYRLPGYKTRRYNGNIL